MITMNKKQFKNVISLGFFCSVALELRNIGLRKKAYPFDWIIEDFQDALLLIKNNFDGFVDAEYLLPEKTEAHFIVRNRKYNIVHFYHDFVEEKTIEEQIEEVSQKYERRIKRFYEDIKENTLFIRYVQNAKEWKYIKKNKKNILNFLKSFNINNEIIYILNDDIPTLLPVKNLYKVKKDTNDVVARNFLEKNKKLHKYLLNVVGAENNG